MISLSEGVQHVGAGRELYRYVQGQFGLSTSQGAGAVLSRGAGIVTAMGQAERIFSQPLGGLRPDQVSGVERALGVSVSQASGLAGSAASIAALALPGQAGAVASRMLSATAGAVAAINRAYQAYQSIGAPLRRVLPSPAASATATPGPSSGQPHLLILTTQRGETYYFGLSTAAYDRLARETSYNIATQERLTRRPALQPVGKGGETISISGAIFCALRGGAGQLNRLRAIGYATEPVMLTTGYGEVLGRWYIMRISEEQDGILLDGVPRKQAFTLEFHRDGPDYSSV